MAEHFLNLCEMAIASGHDIIKCPPIGSCVVIVLYDETKQIGGVAHCLLAQKNGLGSREKEMLRGEPRGKYVETALPALVALLKKAGALTKNLTAKLVGGASVIDFEDPRDSLGIGGQNVERAIQLLKILGIPIKAMDVGGRQGRRIEFLLTSGEVHILTSKMGRRVI